MKPPRRQALRRQQEGAIPSIGNQSGSTGGGAKQAAGDAADQAKQKAGQAKDKANEAAQDQVQQRSDQAGERLSGTADDVRAAGESLRERGNDTGARIAEQAADYAQQVADYLKDSDADRIMSDVEHYARRQPWAVVAGGALLGFAASRVVGASSRNRSAERSSAPSAGGRASDGGFAAPVTTIDTEADTADLDVATAQESDRTLATGGAGERPEVVSTDSAGRAGVDRTQQS